MVSPSLRSGLLGDPSGELVLRVRGTQRHGQKIHIANSKCSIGSSARCSLRLSAPGVQPLHCLILQGERGSVIRRWSSDTRLNGQSFHDLALSVGDRLSVGPLEFDVLALPGAGDGRVKKTSAGEGLKSRLARSLKQAREAHQLTEQQRLLRQQLRKVARRRARRMIDRLRAAQQETTELCETCRSLDETVQSLASEAEEMRQQAVHQQECREAIEQSRQDSVIQLEELSAKFARHEEQWLTGRESHEAELAELRQQAECLQQQVQTQDHELTVLRQESQASKAELESLHLALEEERKQLAEARQQWDQQRGQLEAELNETRQALTAAEEARQQWDQQRGQLEAELNETREALTAAEEARQQWDQQRGQLEAELNEAREALTTAEEARQEDLRRHAMELEEVEDSWRCRPEVQEQAQEVERLAADVSRLQQQLAESAQGLETERSELLARQESCDSERTALEDQYRTLQQQQTEWIERSEEEKKQLAEAREQLNQQCGNLEAELNDARQALTAAEEARQEDQTRLAAEVSRLEQQLAESFQGLETERSQQFARQEACDNERAALEDQYRALQQQQTEWIERSEKENEQQSEARQQWEQERGRFEEELNEARQALTAAEEARQEDQRRHAAESKEVEDLWRCRPEIQEQAREVERLRAEVSRLEQQLAESAQGGETERSELLARQEAWDGERTALEDQCRALQQQQTEWIKRSDEGASDREQVANRQHELEMLAQQLETEQDKLCEERSCWEEEKGQFEKKLQSANEDLDRQRTLLGDEQKSIDQARDQLVAQQKALEDRQIDFHNRYEQLEEQLQDLKMQRERLESLPRQDAGKPDHDQQQPEAREAPVSAQEVVKNIDLHGPDEESQKDFAMKIESPSQEKKSPWSEPPADEQIPSTPLSSDPIESGDHQEEEESIDSYMAGLLQRAGGGQPTGGESSRPADEPSRSVEKVESIHRTAPEQGEQRQEESNETSEPMQFMPRPVPPEMSSNLSAMRDLANQSARSAIDESTRRRWGNAAFGKFLVAGIAALCGGLVWSWSGGANWYGNFGAGVAFVVATFWMLQGSLLLWNLHVLRRQMSDASVPSENGTPPQVPTEAEKATPDAPEEDDISS